MPDKERESLNIGELLEEKGKPDPKDETISALENEIESLKDKHYEERFIWILVCMAIADAFLFSHIDNWTAPLVIGVIELIAIVILADRCKVNTVMPLIDRITGAIAAQRHKDTHAE